MEKEREANGAIPVSNLILVYFQDHTDADATLTNENSFLFTPIKCPGTPISPYFHQESNAGQKINKKMLNS